ncbi:MAG: peptidylprolyl isomerase [Planctomycetota bacterium]|nr:peptidylprolyl isomerase [Planctomycetota bacterium]MDA1113041.1 peptidylprolyl isomerase [Planctomycetota bacterium]
MKLTHTSLLICLFFTLASPVLAQENKKTGPLPVEVAARVDGEAISQADYENFLYQSFGKRPLQQLIDRHLVIAAAKAYAIAPAVEAQQAIFEERLLQAHQGRSEEQFLVSLRDGGLNMEMFKDNLQWDILQELTLDELVRQTRVPTDPRLDKAFEAKFGVGGVKVAVRHILVMPHFLRAEMIKGGTDARSIDQLELKAKAKDLAMNCHEQLEAGADFVALVQEYSHDQASLHSEGLLPSYRPGLYGAAFTNAVASLKPGEFSEVIESGAGFHVVMLESREVTKLENVRAALTEEVMTAIPTWQEREEVLSSLRAKADIQLW